MTITASVVQNNWQFVLAVFSLAALLEVSAWGQVQAFSPLFIERELGVPPDDVPRWTGLLAAAPLLVAAPLSPFWGVVADRYSRKVVIQRCFFAAWVAYLLAALCQDVWQYLGVRFLLGLTFGSNAIIIAVIADLIPNRRLGLAIGITQMMFPVGNSVGPLLGSGLIELFGLRGMLLASGVMAFIGFLLVQLLYREAPRSRTTDESLLRRLGTVGRVAWRVRSIRLAFILFALFAGGWGLVQPFLPVLVARVYEGENVALAIGIVLALNGALAGLAAPIAGRLADWVGPTRLIVFSMVGMAVMSIGLAFSTTPWHVALMLVVGALPYGASNTTLYAHLARHTPREHMSGIMGLSPMARNSAMLVAPLVGAGVAGLGLHAIFLTAVAVYAVATGVSIVLARSNPTARANTAPPDPAA